MPLLVISDNPRYRQVPTGADTSITIEEGRRRVSGFAISPIGLEGQIRIFSRWHAYTAGAAGVVWFSRAVPVAYARSFNYTFELGGGMLWRISSKDSPRIGYKFHHLSNLYTAPQNPGIDGAVFLLGFERTIGSCHRLARPRELTPWLSWSSPSAASLSLGRRCNASSGLPL